VIPSKVQVLTTVGLEHTRWLGPTITDIAAEKLAVVHDHGCLVTGELHPEAEAVAQRVTTERHARRIRAPEEAEIPTRARGAFQRRNFAFARTAAEAFLGELDTDAVRRAADEVEVPGRLQVVAERPRTIHDGAHNPAGARALTEALPEVVGDRRPLVAVVAVLDDKDAAGMLREIGPVCDQMIFTKSLHPRSLPPATLATLLQQLGGPPAEVVASARAAVERARELAGPDGAVLATGSIYLIAELVRDEGAARASAL
jgi:dihydrofolate synthase/folylpolyglutamate synthase